MLFDTYIGVDTIFSTLKQKMGQLEEKAAGAY